jgi:hypothetical protein
MNGVVRIEPTLREPGLEAYECPGCEYVTSVLLEPIVRSISFNVLSAEEQNEYKDQQERKSYEASHLVCRYAVHRFAPSTAAWYSPVALSRMLDRLGATLR